MSAIPPLTEAEAQAIAEKLDGPPHGKVWYSLEQIAERWGLTPTQVYNESKRKTFPKPDLSAGRFAAWLRQDIEQYELTRRVVLQDYCLYRHFDRAGVLLYVGQSVSALTRTSTHRSQSDWFRDVATITIQRFQSRPELDAAEIAAIKTERPIHNKKHRARGP